MARPLSVMAIVLFCALVLLIGFLQETQGRNDASFVNQKIWRHILQTTGQSTDDCGPKCAYRCSKASLQKYCLKDCNGCCEKCGDGCVPSGTSGNKEECPCYNSMKNTKNGPKCP